MAARVRKAFSFCLLMGLLSAFANQAHAQGMRVHMHGADGGYAADGFLYAPAAAKDAPALLLIPDERGVTQRITDTALRFLDAGYVVVVVDLNRGLPADPATRTNEQVDHDLAAALGFVSTSAQVGHDAVGLMGWGSGGAAALRLAGTAQTRAIAIDDVVPLRTYADLSPTRADLLVTLAGRATDPALPSAKELAARLRTLGKTSQIKIYADAESGFDDPEDSPHFDSKKSTDVYARELQFFKERIATHPQ